MEISSGIRKKSAAEGIAQIVFTICASFTIIVVLSIMVYMIANGTPALFKVGISDLLFETEWKPPWVERVMCCYFTSFINMNQTPT